MTRSNRFFTHLALGISLAGGLVAATPAASAQSETHLQVTVPFAFSANKQPMPAGSYSVAVSQQHFLTFTENKTGKSQIAIVRPDVWTANKGKSRLVFHREAGQTYLTQVWVEGQNRHSDLISHPKPQREIAKVSPPASTFEIAMK